MAASGRWGRDRLRKEIDGMLFERTAISSKPDELIKKELSTLRDDNVMSPDLVFKSPYFWNSRDLKVCIACYVGRTGRVSRWQFAGGRGFSFAAASCAVSWKGVRAYRSQA